MKLRDALLFPLSLPYELIVRLRSQAYGRGIFSSRRLPAAVISVGNLTVGGTGKTPMVIWLAERLLAEGKRVGILTRGYRGKVQSAAQAAPSGAVLGSTERDGTNAGSAEPDSASSISDSIISDSSGEISTSDEVQLMRSRLGSAVAFGVGANRFARGLELASRGVEYFILDDGFQHRKLARDIDIVLIDATNPFGGGHLLPAGRLREPRSALARASILVITRGDHSPAIEAAVRHDSNAPVFYAKPRLDSIHHASTNLPADAAALRQKKLFAFCGIGNPPAFLADLREWGFQIAGHKFFPDHHAYTQRDVLLIEAEARTAGCDALISTEKDLFNFRAVRWNIEPLFCRISLQLRSPHEFWSAISVRLQLRPEG